MGFFGTLQPSPEPKLTTPWTSHKPPAVWQFRGPPESPCNHGNRRQPLASQLFSQCWPFPPTPHPPPPPSELTLHPATMPSPPAHTILSVARTLHQSSCEQVSWSTTGRRACWRTSAGGPSAADEDTLMRRSGSSSSPCVTLCQRRVCGRSLESRPQPVT